MVNFANSFVLISAAFAAVASATPLASEPGTSDLVARGYVYRCGSGLGSCPSGQCCSSQGYCGTTSHYCDPGYCKSGYGKCNSSGSSSTSKPSSAYSGAWGPWINQVLSDHNTVRRNTGHSMPSLVWDQRQANAACDCAQRNVNSGGLSHYGWGAQNLWKASAGWNGDDAYALRSAVLNSWYKEESVWRNYGKPAIPYNAYSNGFEKWGHYVQMVQKNARKVGCCVRRGYSGVVVACNYDQGNYAGSRPF